MPAATDAAAEAALGQLLITPEGRADPYPLYRLIRETAPVLRTSTDVIVLSRYDDCLTALRDPRLGRGVLDREDGPRQGAVAGGADPKLRQEFFERGRDNMLFSDPPNHTRLRRLVSRVFTPRRVELLRPAVDVMVRDILDVMADKGESDVMTDLAFPLPVAVIGELVGVPAADRPGFQPLVRASTVGLEPFVDDEGLRGVFAAQDQMRAYFEDLLAERRRHPTDDLLSGLAEASEHDDLLTDAEIISTSILLFAAGFETTTNLIGNGLLALLRSPDQFDVLRRDPSVTESAVEELLRFDSPVQVNSRTALEPAQLLGDPIDEGQVVLVLQGAANRDPERFDHPDQLDLRRGDNAPLSFGWGIHHCLGAALARMEGEVVFRALAERFESVELTSESVEWRPGITLRGLAALPVGLQPA
jgi:cytochrome P450